MPAKTKPLLLFSVIAFFLLCGWLLEAPPGLTTDSWNLFLLFVATLLSIIFQLLPFGAVAILSLTVAIFGKILPIDRALHGYSEDVVWFVLLAFFMARGFVKTGLGERVAYTFIYLFGGTYMGLCFSMILSDLLLAPAIPSNTARGCGIIFPVLKSAIEILEGKPSAGGKKSALVTKSSSNVSKFLILSSFHGNCVTSAMFLTAMAANPLIQEVSQQQGIHLSWGTWALAALVPGLFCLALIPFFFHYIYPPESKDSLHAKQFAGTRLKEMGRVSSKEWIMLFTVILMMFLWVFGKPFWQIGATATALLGLSILLITDVLTFEDLKEEKAAWDIFIWFGLLIMMSNELFKQGVITYFVSHFTPLLATFSWPLVFLSLIVFYFYSHYMFASLTAHIGAMYAAILGMGVELQVPPYLLAFSLAAASNIFGGLAPYSTSTAPVYFGSGYVDLRSWWRYGFCISTIVYIFWISIGSIWWKILGYW